VGGTKNVARSLAATRARSSAGSKPPESGTTCGPPRATKGSAKSPDAWESEATWMIASRGDTGSTSAK
jgi:hypothetical protein